jgi:DNA-binding CsgD family transcriptional regulator
VPKRQRRAPAKPLAEYAACCSDRDRAMAEAYRSGAYSRQAIAGYFGISRMTVSRPVKRDEKAAVTCET